MEPDLDEDPLTQRPQVVALLGLGRNEEALLVCEQAAKLHSDDVTSWLLYSKALISTERFVEVLEAVDTLSGLSRRFRQDGQK